MMEFCIIHIKSLLGIRLYSIQLQVSMQERNGKFSQNDKLGQNSKVNL